MNQKQKVEIFSSYPLFDGLTNEEIETLSKNTREKVFAPKSLLLDQAIPADSVYLIFRGLVKIYILKSDGNIIPIRVHGPMYLIGELNLFDQKSTASVEAVKETHALIFSKADILKLLSENTTVALNMLKIITEKLRAANLGVDNLLSVKLKDRTLQVLKALAKHFPNNEIALSQEELALVIGASRARVTEVLDEFAASGIIKTARRKIQIL